MNLKTIQTEIDASFLYGILADHEEDKNVAAVFRQMSEIEQNHASSECRRCLIGTRCRLNLHLYIQTNL